MRKATRVQFVVDGVRRTAAQFRAGIWVHVDDRDWISPYVPDGYRSGQFELSPALTAALSRLELGLTVHFWCGLKDEQR